MYVHAADVDGDGTVEILAAAASYGVGAFTMYINTGSSFVGVDVAAADGAASIRAADMDGDGGARCQGAPLDARRESAIPEDLASPRRASRTFTQTTSTCSRPPTTTTPWPGTS